MYDIIAIYQGNKEVIDTTDTKKDAIKYANEYRLAFCDKWTIKIKKNY